jgi:hypothetical protein
MLYREIIAAISEIHIKHLTTLSGQIVKCLDIKTGGVKR